MGGAAGGGTGSAWPHSPAAVVAVDPPALWKASLQGSFASPVAVVAAVVASGFASAAAAAHWSAAPGLAPPGLSHYLTLGREWETMCEYEKHK